ncbi:MAG TPA: PAS domain-containing protein, partial [Burkholderiaceae bacterium]
MPSTSALDFEHMFALSPASLWLEDFSMLKDLFDQWRSEGVTDLRAHLRQAPERLSQGMQSIQLVQVNQRTLDLFGASSQQQLMDQLALVFRGDMHDSVAREWEQLWNGSLEFTNQTVNYTLDGRRLDVIVRARILPGHEQSWRRVLVSLEDITEREAAMQRLVRSEQYAQGLFEFSPVSLWAEDFSTVRRLLRDVRAQGITD